MSKQTQEVRIEARTKLPTKYAEFELIGFAAQNGKEHVALILGDLTGEPPVLTRLHSECLTGDALFSQRCDCGPQLEAALKKIAAEGRGVLLYLRQEGRGIGLINKIKAYAEQDKGLDTVEANEVLGFQADAREYNLAAKMLRQLGVEKVRLMTNNPKKVSALNELGIQVTERIPHITEGTSHNRFYLETKTQKLGHLFKEKL